MFKSLLVLVIILSLFCIQSLTQEKDATYIAAVDWSHKGDFIAIIDIQLLTDFAELQVMEVDSGEIVYRFQVNPASFNTLDWSPDDRFLAVGGYDQMIWIFDLETRTHLTTLVGHQATITDLDWNSDGSRLVSSGNWDQWVIIWDMHDYQEIGRIEIADPTSVQFSPDDTQIAIGGLAGVFVYPSSLDVGLDRRSYRYFEDPVESLAWNHYGNRLVASTQTFRSVQTPQIPVYSRLVILDTQTKTIVQEFTTSKETLDELVWSLDGQLIATHSLNGTISVWDASMLTHWVDYHGVSGYSTQISFSPYGGRLAFGSMISDVMEQTNIELGIDRGIQIVVPMPSLDRLNAIAESCLALEARIASVSDETRLPEFVTTIEALSGDQIPPGCKADLLAVAQAIQAIE
jgi:WD40 repeat protein